MRCIRLQPRVQPKYFSFCDRGLLLPPDHRKRRGATRSTWTARSILASPHGAKSRTAASSRKPSHLSAAWGHVCTVHAATTNLPPSPPPPKYCRSPLSVFQTLECNHAEPPASSVQDSTGLPVLVAQTVGGLHPRTAYLPLARLFTHSCRSPSTTCAGCTMGSHYRGCRGSHFTHSSHTTSGT